VVIQENADIADTLQLRDVAMGTIFVCLYMGWYGDSAGNTAEENSSVFSLIRMR